MIRGFLQRRKYRLQQTIAQGKTKYFKEAESRESLSQQKINPRAKTIKTTFQYSTGAKYEG